LRAASVRRNLSHHPLRQAFVERPLRWLEGRPLRGEAGPSLRLAINLPAVEGYRATGQAGEDRAAQAVERQPQRRPAYHHPRRPPDIGKELAIMRCRSVVYHFEILIP